MKGSSIRNNFNLFIYIYLFTVVWPPRGVVVVVVAQSRNATAAVNVGVVLDMDSLVGKIGMSCINMALSDFYAAHPHYETRVVLHTRDSREDIVAASAAALDLIRNVGVQAIIGPRSSMQADFMISLGNKSRVPIISFSATSPSLTSFQSPYFYRAAQSSSSQVKAISAIVKDFGWREVVLIYVDNQFGETIVPFLTAALQEINTRVSSLSVVPESASDDRIAVELYKLKEKQTRVFIVNALMRLGTRILAKAEEIGMMSEGYVWIMTETMTSFWRSADSSAVSSFQGVLGVRTYVHKSEKLENFTVRWKRKFQGDNPDVTNAELNNFGLWAYDATFALAMAVEKAGTATLGFDRPDISGVSTDLETLGVSRNGPRLVQELSNISFRGLSGDFHFVNGQLNSSVFQIVNVNGNGERRVGFWTPETGLIKNLSENTTANPTSKTKLGPIIWPGEVANSVPKGWEFPTEGKRLKIGVPVKVGFTEFLEVKWDNSNSSGAKSVQGYCIDVFDHAMAKMPYPVLYDYIPFATPDRKPSGSYNDLVDQVYYGIYDAVVGDVTIVANRSLFVDYTLPFTESGVSMLVPIRDNKKKNAWVFLQPLTPDLWVTSGCFFVFIGFVVWVLEHRINDDFRGPPTHQVGTSFWFSFSTMVFAHREKVVSNAARFVVIIWCFVVLILTQSYTASLTSLLTVEQLQPTVTDINELLKRKENVGFLDGSFVEGILLKLKFDESQLKKYTSPEELNELFLKGSANGGISAAFDEIPYINLFLSKYCGKYTTIKPTFKTDGFGFVFPKGSPLVSDVSSAILNVTQGDEMEQILNKWFKSDQSCPDVDPIVSSTRLGLDSFWGLFLLAAIASIVALIIFAAMFLYEQRHVLFQLRPETSLWRKVGILSRIFDQKDMSSHTFKKTEQVYAGSHCSVHDVGVNGSSPNTNCPPSPSSMSNRTDSSDFVFIVAQGSNTNSPDMSPAPETGRSSVELADYRHGG